ncbi:hypothetical protein DSM14862_04143 (plasmid) [Sulfitobacter indolifex]|nr:hypothetical protein DSM14862_04143 [Sulfitobacter indolifex]
MHSTLYDHLELGLLRPIQSKHTAVLAIIILERLQFA